MGMGFQFEQHRLGLWDLSWDLKKTVSWEMGLGPPPPSRPSSLIFISSSRCTTERLKESDLVFDVISMQKNPALRALGTTKRTSDAQEAI